MNYRRLALRVLGLGVAALVLLAATQLLLLSFESDPLFSRSRIETFNDWVRGRPRPGPGILLGVALAGVSVWLAWAVVKSLGTDRRVITTRRRGGWTKLDRATLEDSIERRLETIDRRNDVDVSITHRGRVDVNIITPDPSALGPVQELRDAIDELCGARALPCRSGRITASVPRRLTARRRVR